MMKTNRKSKKMVAVLLAVCLGTMMSPAMGVAAAAETPESPAITQEMEIQPRLSYINSAYANFFSSGAFSTGITVSSAVDSIEITVALQKKGLFGYSDVDSLTHSASGTSANYADSFDLGSGTYRLEVTFTAYAGSASETVTRTATY